MIQSSISKIKKELQGAVSPKVFSLCCSALSMKDFSVYPASLNRHHSFKGGLALHTLETIQVAKSIHLRVREIDFDVVATALVFHDTGKLVCYERQDQGCNECPHWVYRKSHLYYSTYHVVISYQNFMKKACKFPMDFKENVGHCILSHHRTKENGSPVTPNTKEAWLVCMSDSASVTLFTDEYPKPEQKEFYGEDGDGDLYKIGFS